MSPRPFRLPPGVDLRRELERLVRTGGIGAGFVVAGVGSVGNAVLRFANDAAETVIAGPHEVLTLSGSLTATGAHLHACVSSVSGQVLGGHVGYGNLVRTTAELLLLETPAWNMGRAFDERTGYEELVVSPVTVALGRSDNS